MKLNIDCVRDILIQCEDIPLNGYILIADLISSLPKYSEDDIAYSCLELYEEGRISCVIKKYSGNPYVKRIKDITPSGHELLNKMRSDTFFSKIKENLPATVSTIGEVVSVIKSLSH